MKCIFVRNVQLKREKQMQEPKLQYKSGKYISMPEFHENTLLAKLYVHPECIDRVQERMEDQREDDDEPIPEIEEWEYNTELFTLKQLMDMSEGIDPSQVMVSVHRDRKCMDISVRVTQKTPFTKEDKKKWKAEREIEDNEFEQRRKIYNEEKAKYDLWKAEQELKTMQDRISKMKK